jgi:hypothetical protein
MRTTTIAISAAALAAGLAAYPAFAQPAPTTISGELTDSDTRGEEEHRYDDHTIRLDAGQRYRVTVESEAFDTVAQIRQPGQDTPLAENDDYGEGLNSRINFSPRDSGDYILRVTGFAADARGAYSAKVEQLPPLPAPISTAGTAVTTTGTWSLWEGALAETDPDHDGRHYVDYLVHFDAGQRRFISLEAVGDWDPLVEILNASDREGDAVDQDDDSGTGFNSLLAFQAEEAGDYIVRVSSFGEGTTGNYRLWVSQ